MTPATLGPRLVRRVAGTALFLASLATPQARAADPAPFDLPGPGLRVSVTRAGVTLPIGQVPDLAAGDRLVIHADLPEDQRVRFRLVSAFLSGATNPPPKDWIDEAETWKRKEQDRALTLIVPKGARQLVLFVVPETGGAKGTIADAVRGKPGEFVRAIQAINQASLDRSRLNAFVAAIRAQENSDPEHLKRLAPTLARSLSIKLNTECLDRVVEFQAACLLENRDSLVLADMHSSSVAETLAGTPTDLALQLSYTREAGFGYYSQYIAVVRDIARLFGAFSNPQFRYLPALGLQERDKVSLVLNAAPSFSKPKSVLVASMPAIGSDRPPRLRASRAATLCGADPDLVLPVEGAPLIYSTDYAREMVLRLNGADFPVQARPERGGYVLRTPLGAERQGNAEGRLHGLWGFQPFAGPAFTLQFPNTEVWRTAETATLVTGRENKLDLTGTAPSCVSSVVMRIGEDAPRPVAFTAQGERGLTLTLPLKDVRPGAVTLEIREMGRQTPVTISLQAYREASRVNDVIVHAGDLWGELTGQRLDLVGSVEVGKLRLLPDGLTRDGSTDRLRVAGSGEGLPAGNATARVILSDRRTLKHAVTIRPPRIQAKLLDRSVRATLPGSLLPVAAAGDTLLPDTGLLQFSLRAANGTVSIRDTIEIAGAQGQTVRLAAGPNLQPQGTDVLVATLDPAALGPSAFGPLRFRLVREDEASDWRPLATLVRLPKIDSVACDKRDRCTITGQSLFLIQAVASTPVFDKPVLVPDGYTGRHLEVPAPQNGRLFLRLTDAPSELLSLDIAGQAQASRKQ